MCFWCAIRTTKAPRRRFKFRATAAGEPEVWDALRNEITSIPFHRSGENAVEFSLSMEPLETALIVFQPRRPARPLRIEADVEPLREPIALTRDPNSPAPESVAARLKSLAHVDLTGCKWIWFPEGNPAVRRQTESAGFAGRLPFQPIARSSGLAF